MGATKARSRWKALLRMTVVNGCTPAEAATAARLAKVLATKYGFDGSAKDDSNYRPDFEARYEHAERRAAAHFNWEYRRCYRKCHCMRGGLGHGPYKYAKQRTGRKVCSVYLGK